MERYRYLFLEQHMEFGSAVMDTESVCGIDNPDETVRLFKVVFPVGTQGLLSPDVPLLDEQT